MLSARARSTSSPAGCRLAQVVRVLADALESIRIPCVIHDVDGLGHEYPSLPTFAEIVADVPWMPE